MSDVPVDFFHFCTDVLEEVIRAEAKWPPVDTLTRAAAIAGEAGEVVQAVLKERPSADIRAEAVQVAATAYRLYKEL